MPIRYALAACRLGRMFVAATPAGICAVFFGDADNPLLAEAVGRFGETLQRADDDPLLASVADAVDDPSAPPTVPLDLHGTPFQQRVWAALQTIPAGRTTTYAALAKQIGRPAAVRAVGTACGANPVAVLVPCHRVLRSDGGLGGYRWGLDRKIALLNKEQAAITPALIGNQTRPARIP